MIGLRIGMASPWNLNSAIAQSASEVAFELVRRGHSVTVLRTEMGSAVDLTVRPAPGAIRHLSDYSDIELRRDFDAIVGQIGNHFPFHGALLARLEAIDVVGVFHDAAIPHLLAGWVDDWRLLDRMAATTYSGTTAAEGPFCWDDLAYVSKNHPMLEWVARRTVGGVAHSHHYLDRLRSACPGPVAVIPLAFDVPDLPPPPVPWNRAVIAIVGHANSNKRIDQIIYGISASYVLRTRCRLRVIGEATAAERTRLTELAQDIGMEPPEFTGWVSDENLRRQLRDVDVISCLRNPVLEGASASLILGLMSGRPVLITDHGCYADVPSDAALKCAPESEALDVLIHLEHLMRDPTFGIAIGERGRAFATGRHTASAYVDALMPLLECCVAAQPIRYAARDMSKSLAQFGLDAEDCAVVRAVASVNTMVSELF